MDNALLNAHKLTAQGIASRTAAPRYGVVQSVDPANHAARVTVQPEGVLTGWLPIMSHSIGNGWGIVSLPLPGTQVMLTPQEGDGEEWAVAGRVFDTAALPPSVPAAISGSASNAQPGEIALVSKAGAVIRLAADGTVYIKAPTVNIEGSARISGNLEVDGDITVLGTHSGSTGALTAAGEIYDLNKVHGHLDTLRQAYDGHLHTGVQSGGSDTGPTTIPTP